MLNKPKVGDIIEVIVDGKKYNTIIDNEGIQRFIKNEVIRKIIDSHMTPAGNIIPGMLNLSKIAELYQLGKIPLKDYLEFYILKGSSVTMIAEMEAFKTLEIINPLWEK
jgi:hypothetical protein